MDTVNKAGGTESVTTNRRVSTRLKCAKQSPSKGTAAGTGEEGSSCDPVTPVEENSCSLEKSNQDRESNKKTLKKTIQKDKFPLENTETLHQIPSNKEFQKKENDDAVDVQLQNDKETLAVSDEQLADSGEIGTDFSSEDLTGNDKETLAASDDQLADVGEFGTDFSSEDLTGNDKETLAASDDQLADSGEIGTDFSSEDISGNDKETLAASDNQLAEVGEFGTDFTSEDLIGKMDKEVAISVGQVEEESPDNIVVKLEDSAMEVDQDKYFIHIDLQNLDIDLLTLISSTFGVMTSSRTEDKSKAIMRYTNKADTILAARVLGRLQLGATKLSVQCQYIAEDTHSHSLDKEQNLMTQVSEILSDEGESYTWHQDSDGVASTGVEAGLQDAMEPSVVEAVGILPSLTTNKRPRDEDEDSTHSQQNEVHEKRSRFERLTTEKDTKHKRITYNKESIGDADTDVNQDIDWSGMSGCDQNFDDVDIDFHQNDNDEDMFDYDYSEEEHDKEQTGTANMLLEDEDKSLETMDTENISPSFCQKKDSDSISTTMETEILPKLHSDVDMVNLLLKSVDDTPLRKSFVKLIEGRTAFSVYAYLPSEKGWLLSVPKCYAVEIQEVLDGVRLLDCTLAASLDTDEDVSQYPSDPSQPVREQMKMLVCSYNHTQIRRFVNQYLFNYTMDPLTYRTMVCTTKDCNRRHCLYSHCSSEFRQPVFYRHNNEKDLSLAESSNIKFVKTSSFFKNICQLATPAGECSKFPNCTNAHPDSPDLFFHSSWKDLYVKGLNKSLPFLAGAIKNVTVNSVTPTGFGYFDIKQKRIEENKKSPIERAKTNEGQRTPCMVLYITQSVDAADAAKQVVHYICNRHCCAIATNIDTPSQERTPVVIAHLSQVLSAVVRNPDLFISFKVLILDDASALLAGSNAAMLEYFFSRLWSIRQSPEDVDKVVVSSMVHQNEILAMQTLLRTTFNVKLSVPHIDKYLPSLGLDAPGNSHAPELVKLHQKRRASIAFLERQLRRHESYSYKVAAQSQENRTRGSVSRGRGGERMPRHRTQRGRALCRNNVQATHGRQELLAGRQPLSHRLTRPARPLSHLHHTITDTTRESEIPQSHSRRDNHAVRYRRNAMERYDDGLAIVTKPVQSTNRRFGNTQHPPSSQLNYTRSTVPLLPTPSRRSAYSFSTRHDSEALPPVPAPSYSSSRRHDSEALPPVSAPSYSSSRRHDSEALPPVPAPPYSSYRRHDSEALPPVPAPSYSSSRRHDSEALPPVPAPSYSSSRRHDSEALPPVPAPSYSSSRRHDSEALPYVPALSDRGSRRYDSEALPYAPGPSNRDSHAHKPSHSATPPLQRRSDNSVAPAGVYRPVVTGRSSSGGLQAMLNSLVSSAHAVPVVGPAVEIMALAAGNFGQNTRKALDLLAEPDHHSLLKVYVSQLDEVNKRESNGVYESTLIYSKGLLNLIKTHTHEG